MNTIRSAQTATRKHAGLGARLLVAAMLLGFGSLAQAAPLNLLLLPEPDISSSFITVDYNATTDILTASGFANQLATGGGLFGISGGSFDLIASVSGSGNLLGAGSLTIGGMIASLGFNSGTLLSGSVTAIGFNQANDPLEFLFSVTGGDAAALYGGIGGLGGIILNDAGFPGDWTGDFTSGAFQATSDVGVVPVPAAVWLFGSALLGLLGFNARKKHQPEA